MSYDVFISYSRTDTVIMQRVRDTLREAGFTVWTDEGIEPGTPSWKIAIEEAIEGAAALVVLFSPASSDSKWVRNELDFAEAQGKPIYPLMIRGDAASAVPFGYTSYQWIDLREEAAFGAGMTRLMRVLRGERAFDAADTHPQMPVISDEEDEDGFRFTSAVTSDKDGIEMKTGVSGFGQITALVPILGFLIVGVAIAYLLLSPDLVSAPDVTAEPTRNRAGAITTEAGTMAIAAVPEDWRVLRGEQIRVAIPPDWTVTTPDNDALLRSALNVALDAESAGSIADWLEIFERELIAGQITSEDVLFLIGVRRTFPLAVNAEFYLESSLAEAAEFGTFTETSRTIFTLDERQFLRAEYVYNGLDAERNLYIQAYLTMSADNRTGYSLLFANPENNFGASEQTIRRIVSSFQLRED